jgi:hypothetical protein
LIILRRASSIAFCTATETPPARLADADPAIAVADDRERREAR